MFKLFALKSIYRAFLTGFPILTYNPFTHNSFHTDFTVNKYSTYANYKLNDFQTNYLSEYLQNYTNSLKLLPVKIDKKSQDEDYFISVNIYNCSSPLFNIFDKNPVTRCEINTYVQNNDGVNGTLIMDYSSNRLSMDPDDFFRKPKNTYFKKHGNTIFTFSRGINHEFSLKYKLNNKKRFYTSSQLHRFSDNIFYKCGIIDKLYYDSSLTKSVTYNPSIYFDSFIFKDLIFKEPYNIFYFNNSINFAGSMWDNLYENDSYIQI